MNNCCVCGRFCGRFQFCARCYHNLPHASELPNGSGEGEGEGDGFWIEPGSHPAQFVVVVSRNRLLHGPKSTTS